ncbi:hypothetical protein J8273_0494 [Carpediemonas membranifera]|uniref:Uncharacterized protein n=1 Tax=Carpediemonas membranifera TaxID=201153 RepID=A0A8J6BZ79_9EUKA|nr:hypothetical protein J8273_0494 [Carpediemonas membranifera]|eukprot:KAG9395271.1 hypothetical protein J8273_0494 [Carpediemonas membranifera]
MEERVRDLLASEKYAEAGALFLNDANSAHELVLNEQFDLCGFISSVLSLIDYEELGATISTDIIRFVTAPERVALLIGRVQCALLLAELIHTKDAPGSIIVQYFGMLLLHSILSNDEIAASESWLRNETVHLVFQLAVGPELTKTSVLAHKCAGILLSTRHETQTRTTVLFIVERLLQKGGNVVQLGDIVSYATEPSPAATRIGDFLSTAIIDPTGDVLVDTVLRETVGQLIATRVIPSKHEDTIILTSIEALKAGDGRYLSLLCSATASIPWLEAHAEELDSMAAQLLAVLADNSTPERESHHGRVVEALCDLLVCAGKDTRAAILPAVLTWGSGGERRQLVLHALATSLMRAPTGELGHSVYSRLQHLAGMEQMHSSEILHGLVASSAPGDGRLVGYFFLVSLAMCDVRMLIHINNLIDHLISRSSEPDDSCLQAKYEVVRAVDDGIRRQGIRHEKAADISAYRRTGPYAPAPVAIPQCKTVSQ